MSSNNPHVKNGKALVAGFQLLAATHTHNGVEFVRGDLVPLNERQLKRLPEEIFDPAAVKVGDTVRKLPPETKKHAEAVAAAIDPTTAVVTAPPKSRN